MVNLNLNSMLSDEEKNNFEETLFKSETQIANKFIDTDDRLILPGFVNFDEYFSFIPDAILINRIPLESDYVKKIIQLICSDDSKKSLVPSCDCGNLEGEFYINDVEPIICPKCKTKVTSLIYSDIKNNIWLDIPSYFEGGVMHPMIFKILDEWLTVAKEGTSYLRYILDPKEKMPEDIAPFIKGKGFNYLYHNFDYIINFFSEMYPKTANRANKFLIRLLLDKYRDLIWCKKIPILSSILQPITQAGQQLRYVSEDVQILMNAIINLIDININEKTSLTSNIQYEKLMYKVYISFIDYINEIVKEELNKKEGLFRQHTFGTRLHLSFRTVIVPIVEEHFGDEVHLPWKIGLNSFKYHVLSYLINRENNTVAEAYGKVIKAFFKYDYEIDQIFQILIKECPYKGFPIILNRPPSLNPAALETLFVTKIKPALKNIDNVIENEKMLNTYINDETIGFSTLIVKGKNAD